MRGRSDFVQKLTIRIFLGLTAAAIFHGLYFYPQLPDVVASHFGAGGRPDAWSGKGVFITIYLVTVGMNALIFLGIAFGIQKMPASTLNLPNKEYWLTEERRQETFDFFIQYFLWFGIATCLLLLDMFHQTFMVHLGKESTLQHPWLSMGLYLGFSLLWCIGLLLKFFRKQGS